MKITRAPSDNDEDLAPTEFAVSAFATKFTGITEPVYFEIGYTEKQRSGVIAAPYNSVN